MSGHRSRKLMLAFLLGAALALVSIATAVGAPAKKKPFVDNKRGSKLVPQINPRKNGKGVTKNAIKIVFNFPIKNCDTGAAGIAPQQTDDATVLVKWFNEHVPFPGGRKLELMPFVDDGGFGVGCAATARAAGLKAARELGAFASIGNSSNLDGNSVYASTVTANGTVDIAPAGSFQLQKDFTDRWPYAWGVLPPGDETFAPLAAFIGKRVKNTQYVANNGTKSARKWGMIFFDSSLGKSVAAVAKKQLAAYGIKPKAYYVSGDPTQFAQQATSLAAQIKSDGVNSIVYGVNAATTDIPLVNAFNSQKLFPDWYMSDYSLVVKFAVYANTLLFPNQADRIHATNIPDIVAARIDVHADGSNGQSAKLQDNDWRTAATNAYKQAGGKAANPQAGADLSGIWWALSTLAVGIINAGPTLNAFTFANGLVNASSCDRQRFFGQAQRQNPFVKFSRNEPWAMHGFTTYYWQSKKESTFGSTKGYFESYDGYEVFLNPKKLPATPIYDTGVKGNYPFNPQKEGRFSPTMKCP